MKFIQDLLTERDGTSWCIGRVVGAGAAAIACYKFAVSGTDYLAFSGGIATIIAAIGWKNMGEK